jgi:hypothetical protein
MLEFDLKPFLSRKKSLWVVYPQDGNIHPLGVSKRIAIRSFWRSVGEQIQWLPAKFPKQLSREFLGR